MRQMWRQRVLTAQNEEKQARVVVSLMHGAATIVLPTDREIETSFGHEYCAMFSNRYITFTFPTYCPLTTWGVRPQPLTP